MTTAIPGDEQLQPLAYERSSNGASRDSSLCRTQSQCTSSNSPGSFEFAVSKSHWQGLEHISRLIVFGDSFCRFGDENTWLSYFLQSINRGRQAKNGLEASNYASPGSTVEDDLADQLNAFFKHYPKKSCPESTPSLDPNSTLYIFCLGINDCSRTDIDDLEELVNQLFEDGLDDVFVKAGGRNFLLIDVPPKDRSPGARAVEEPDLGARYTTWNTLLRHRAEAFAADSPQASLFLFSSYKVVTSILDDPEEYDFSEDDVDDVGAIWLDELHLSSEVHQVIAEELVEAFENL